MDLGSKVAQRGFYSQRGGTAGGKPRPGTGYHKPGRGTSKQPVFGMVERGGNIKRQVVADVSGKTLKAAIRECVNPSATIMSDEWPSYHGVGKAFAGGHHVVNHGRKEYVRGRVHTNTIDGFWSQVKRSLDGTHHSVSPKYLQSYVNEFSWRYSHRFDGELFASLVAKTGLTQPKAAAETEI